LAFLQAIAISNENIAAAIVAAGEFIGLGLSQVESLRIKKE